MCFIEIKTRQIYKYKLDTQTAPMMQGIQYKVEVTNLDQEIRREERENLPRFLPIIYPFDLTVNVYLSTSLMFGLNLLFRLAFRTTSC
jgi:hypothetical protein